MTARTEKCFATATSMVWYGMQQSNNAGETGQSGFDRFYPKLSIAGGAIQYLDNNDFRYLGRPINTQAL